MARVAVFGLGAMGNGIAALILRADHTTYAYDIAAASVAWFRDEGGASGALPREIRTLT